MKRKHLAVVGLFTLAAALMVAPPEPTTAAWTLPQGAQGTFTAGTVLPPTSLMCTAGGLLTKAAFSWTAPVSGGLTRTEYQWTLTPQGGTASLPNRLPASATELTVDAGVLDLGISTVSLVAIGPGGWRSVAVEGTVSRVSLIGIPVASGCST
ncbi:hypothetical protein ARGLB_080_00640 [Arthrobacter globiformis NBRC 12137]|uniref:Ig-like domain-containing protein n=1 Tax=Arthrobacter globiformis (strain ATCC 8010 / DSM 20124 / JCM 1332 / NBRC 12137 / NCIMB 8907 / NRRL B-2979 / 168) TaxID=1077972 RepID=H0QQ99_ARTG1|nr:hypothetical protein ARGLB_080_00640 [Arthrobacter globiformis NBRC 12137]